MLTCVNQLDPLMVRRDLLSTNELKYDVLRERTHSL